MMKVLTVLEMAKMICKFKKKHGMYIHIYFPEVYDVRDVYKAAPYLLDKKHTYASFFDTEGGLLLFDTAKERDNAFAQTVGDDGPTKLNKYKGPVRVYALTIDTDGEPLNENT